MKKIFIIFVMSLISRQVVSEDGPILVYLAEKSKLIAVGTQKEITTDRPMTVYASEENPHTRKQYWIYNNKKEKKYLTSAFNITELESDLNLLPKVESTHVYRNTPDSQMNFGSNLTFHFEQVSMSEFGSLYNAQTNTASSTRYELRTLYQTQVPIQFGLNLNFQNISWANGNEQVQLTLVSVGPSFSLKLLNSDSLSLSILSSAEIAPIAQGRSNLYSDNFSAFSFDAGIEAEIPNRFGIFTLGTHLRQYLLLLSNTNRTNIAPTSSEYELTSIGLSVGYKVEWEL